MSDITLAQFKSILERNVLTDPPLMVRNGSLPRGDIAFQVLDDTLRNMKTVIVPANPQICDLTHFAPLECFFASSSFNKLVDTSQLIIQNPEDLPVGHKPLPETTIQAAQAGDTAIQGNTAPDATVIIMQGENTWHGASGVGGAFVIPVVGLVEGQVTVFVSAAGYISQTFTFPVGAKDLTPLPAATITKAEYLGTEVTGTTEPLAEVTVTNDSRTFTATADGDGEFTVVTDPLQLEQSTLRVTLDGYLPHTQTFLPANINMTVVIDDPTFFDTQVTGDAAPFAEVEVRVDGQPSVNVTALDNGSFSATVTPIMGQVVVEATAAGYNNGTQTKTPPKLVLGAITVNAVTEGTTSVSGTVVANAAANDLTATVVTPKGEQTGNVTAGAFAISNLDTTGAGNGSVTIKSAFYQDKTQAFTITPLQDIPDPTVQPLTEGDTMVIGDTVANAVIMVTQGAIHSNGTSNDDGEFSIVVDALAVGDLDIEISAAGYKAEQFVVDVAAYPVVADPTVASATEGDTTVTGTTLPLANVVLNQGAVTGSDVSDDQGDFEITTSGPLAEGPFTLDISADKHTAKQFSFDAAALPSVAEPVVSPQPIVGDTTVTGTAAIGAHVVLTQGSVTGEADASSNDGQFSITTSGPLVSGEYSLRVSAAGFKDTVVNLQVAVNPAP